MSAGNHKSFCGRMKLSRREFIKLSGMMAGAGIIGSWGCADDNSFVLDNPESETDPHIFKGSNAIMIVVDTLRADHLSVMGYPRDTTPNLLGLADNSYVFENAIAPSSWTLPCYTSLMTGKYAFNHNQHFLPRPILNQRMLPELLHEADYNTVIIFTNDVIKGMEYAFNEQYDCCSNDQNRGDKTAIDTAINWLNKDDNLTNNFLMVVWLLSPHAPYQTGTNFLQEFVFDELYRTIPVTDVTMDCDNNINAIRYDQIPIDLKEILGPPKQMRDCYQDSNLYMAAYDSNIKFADQEIGRFLDFLKERGLYDDIMLAFTADHGENMVDHEEYFMHGMNLYQSLIHVPLFIKFPFQRASVTFESSVRTIDVLPTIFDIIGANIDDIDGKSLIPLISGNGDLDDRPCISYLYEQKYERSKVSIISEGYKLIKTGSEDELYDIKIDHGEENNIAGQNQNICNSLSEYLSLFYL